MSQEGKKHSGPSGATASVELPDPTWGKSTVPSEREGSGSARGNGSQGASPRGAGGGASGGVLSSAGALVAAVLASLCCVGPILFVLFGVGAGLASTFEPLRPWFTGAAVLFLGAGFWSVYGRPSLTREGEDGTASAADDASCRAPGSRRREKAILWTATGIVAVVWTFPYWSLLFL